MPWRKRLGDLAQLIEQADATYFEPDLFRINVNNAIQTARTVTFLIQKHKASIKDFDEWYLAHVLEPFKNDRIMNWLKESRNRIEKEGDLEVYSECILETVFSYTDEGPRISLKNEGLLFIGVKRLIRRIRDIFPTGVFRDSAISVERRWIATSLRDFEITDALVYGHSALLKVVDSLDEYIAAPRGPNQSLSKIGSRTARRVYLKTDDGKFYRLGSRQTDRQPIDVDRLGDRYDMDAIRQAFNSTGDLKLASDRFTELASSLLIKDGYHITIGFLLDEDGKVIQMVQPHFTDHVDKIIFWREMALAAEVDTNFYGIIFISEIWIRFTAGFPQRRISDLPIAGEGLQILAADRDTCIVRTVPFVKVGDAMQSDLSKGEVSTEGLPNFLVPLRKAWEARLNS
jgi:hypothetical protein